MSQEIHRAKSIGRLLYNSLGVEIALSPFEILRLHLFGKLILLLTNPIKDTSTLLYLGALTEMD